LSALWWLRNPSRSRRVPRAGVSQMSNRAKYAAVGAVVALVLLLVLPWWLAVPIIAIPVVGYFMLDPSQRRRLNRVTRKQLDR
jgi:hypothetical protein